MPVYETLDIKSDDPALILINETSGNIEGAQDSSIFFEGTTGSNTFNSLASITGSHSGTGTDNKGQIIFKINDGSNSLTEIMTLRTTDEITTGTAQTATNDTITLASGKSSVDDTYNNYIIKITSGTGAGQTRKITDYNGTTKVATIDSAWTTNPDSTSDYSIVYASVTINGSLNVNSIISSTNTTITDNIIELNNGVSANVSDSGIIIERGSTGDNAFMGWDESADKFVLGTTTSTGSSTGNLNISPSDLVVSNITNSTTGNSVNLFNTTTEKTTLGGGAVDVGAADSATTVKGSLNVDQAVTLDTTLEVTGITTLTAALNANGGIACDTNKFTVADTSGNVSTAGTLDVTGDTSVSTFDSSGATSLATGGGVVNIATSAVMTTVKGTLNVDEAVTLDTTLGVTGVTTLSNNLNLASDAAVLNFGADSDVNLTHVADTGLLLNDAMELQLRDSNVNISSSSSGTFDLNTTSNISGTWGFTASSNTWTCSTTHGLFVGDIIRFKSRSSGPPNYGIDTDYFVITKNIGGTTVQLSTTSGGGVLNSNADTDTADWTAIKIATGMGNSWKFDHTGGTVENMWYYVDGGGSAANHNLSEGDRIMFTSSSGGASPYAVNTIYYVNTIVSSTQVLLSASKNGTVLVGTADDSGFWGAVLFDSDININTESLVNINSDNIFLNGNVETDCLKIRNKNELRFYSNAGSAANYVGFEAPSLSGNQIWVLPPTDGEDGEFLKTDGSGALGWASAGGGGSSTTINNNGNNKIITGSQTSGTLNAEANLSFDGSTLALTGALTSTGTITANAGILVDNITIDGTEIDLSSGDLTIDVAGNIILDADDGTITFSDNGSSLGTITSAGYSGNSATATNVTVSANNSTDESIFITFVRGATGSQGIETDTELTYNPSTGVITTTSVTGNLTGNLTGTVLTATQGTIDHDSLANFVANEHIDHSSVSVIAGSGLTGGGTIAADRTLNVIGGDGITANANDIAITAAQTTITSVLNAALVVGRDTDNQIKFSTDNQIIFCAGGDDGVRFKASGEIEAISLSISGDADIDGTLEAAALIVNDVTIDGKVITMTGSSGDTAVFTVGTNGTLTIVTTDADAAAANITITADGAAELAGTTVTLNSSNNIDLDADGGNIVFKDGGTPIGKFTISNTDFVIKSVVQVKILSLKVMMVV